MRKHSWQYWRIWIFLGCFLLAIFGNILILEVLVLEKHESPVVQKRSLSLIAPAREIPVRQERDGLPVAVPSSFSTDAVYTGITLPVFPTTSAVTAFAHEVGKQPTIIENYLSWGATDGSQLFPAGWVEAIHTIGSIPMITWEPWQAIPYPGGIIEPSFSLETIVKGKWDSYITQWARASAEVQIPYFLRFAPEMNGTWIPWGVTVNSNTPQLFIAAWRHIHTLFTKVGATNVSWVWTPNDVEGGNVSLQAIYPGNAYVDWVGIDVFNWGKRNDSSWQSFAQVMANSYQVLQQVAPKKPIVVAETASSPLGGSKAQWIHDLYQFALPHLFPAIKAIIYFDQQTQEDWRLTTPPDALIAFQKSMQLPYYIGKI